MNSIEALAKFLSQDEPWKDEAACKTADTNLFFPGRGESKLRAKSICASCPVGDQCDDYATRTGSEHGIWNGKIRRRGPEKELQLEAASEMLETAALASLA